MSSLSAVLPHLEQRFDSQRLVFWHDADGEYAAQLYVLVLSDVTTVRVENNEYAVKNRVLHDEPAGQVSPVPGRSCACGYCEALDRVGLRSLHC
ncbi:hypothetical protein [Propioniciclava flava]